MRRAGSLSPRKVWVPVDHTAFPSVETLAARASLTDLLLPLPLPDMPYKSNSKSHRIRSRYQRKKQVWKLATLATHALNALCKGDLRHQTQGSHAFSRDEMTMRSQRQAQLHLLQEAATLAKVRRGHDVPTGAQHTHVSMLLKSAIDHGYSLQ
jgi:hypothetical protein